jgi:hypothetical protein
MAVLLVQLGLMGLNIYSAKSMERQSRNPGFQYFVAGLCCMGAIHELIKLLV